MFEIELAGLAEHERDPVSKPFVVVRRNDVDIACRRERALGRIREHREYGRRADDVKIAKIESAPDLVDHVLQLAPVHGWSRHSHSLEDPSAFPGRYEHRAGGLLPQRIGLFRGLCHRPQQCWQGTCEEGLPAVVVDATVRVYLAEPSQPFAHNPSQIRIGCDAPRRTLVQPQAAQRRNVVSSGGVIAGRSATAFDGNLPFGTQTIQHAP